MDLTTPPAEVAPMEVMSVPVQQQEQVQQEEPEMGGVDEGPLPTPFESGEAVLCEHNQVWYNANVTSLSWRTKKRQRVCMYKVHYEGFAVKFDEWLEGGSRLNRKTPENVAMAAASMIAAEAAAAARREAAKPPPSLEPPEKKKRSARASHPPYTELVARAIHALRSKTGSSAVAISRWIVERYQVNPNKYKQSIAQALKACILKGELVKTRASFAFSPTEQRIRDGTNNLKVEKAAVVLLEDSDLPEPAASKRVLPSFKALPLSPNAAAGDVLTVAEFVFAFDPLLGHNSHYIGDGEEKISLEELDAAVAALKTDGPSVVPALLERLIVSLLRMICGRDTVTGGPDDENSVEIESMLFQGHRQNRRMWGHCLNAVTWPDVLRRHLDTERRYRSRLRTALPSTHSRSGAPSTESWKPRAPILDHVASPNNKKPKLASPFRPPTSREESKEERAARAKSAAEANGGAWGPFAPSPTRMHQMSTNYNNNQNYYNNNNNNNNNNGNNGTNYTNHDVASPYHGTMMQQQQMNQLQMTHQQQTMHQQQMMPRPYQQQQPQYQYQQQQQQPQALTFSQQGPLYSSPSSRALPMPPPAAMVVAAPSSASPSKKRKGDPALSRAPYDEEQEGDEPHLAEAIYELCDRRSDFSSLRPELGAAVLKSLCDDVLETPCLQRSLREGEDKKDALARHVRTCQAAKRRAYDDNSAAQAEGRSSSPASVANAEKALDEAQREHEEASLEHACRREELGDSRCHTRHWRLLSDGGKRVTIRLHDTDPRLLLEQQSNNKWGVFESVSKVEALIKSLEVKGVRECNLAQRLQRDMELPRLRTKTDGEGAIVKGKKKSVVAKTGGAGTTELPLCVEQQQQVVAVPPYQHKVTPAERLSEARRLVPSSGTRCASLPWPRLTEDGLAAPPAPLVNNKKTTRSAAAELLLQQQQMRKEGSEQLNDALKAQTKAAPWRAQHARRESALAFYLDEVKTANARLVALSSGGRVLKPSEYPAPACAVPSGAAYLTKKQGAPPPCSVSAVAKLALETEDLLFNFVSHGRECDMEVDPEGAKVHLFLESKSPPQHQYQLPLFAPDYYAGATASAVAAMLTTSSSNAADVEDKELQRDWAALCGSCADDMIARSAWREELRELAETTTQTTARDAASARLCCLLGLLGEQTARHLSLVESRVEVASKALIETAESSGAGAGAFKKISTVYAPSDFTDRVVWARIRGYPWWPAHLKKAKSAAIARTLSRRNLSLLIFFGESVQYLLPETALAEFTGDANDARLPKPGKGSAKGLQEAVKLARIAQAEVLGAEGAPLSSDENNNDDGDDAA